MPFFAFPQDCASAIVDCRVVYADHTTIWAWLPMNPHTGTRLEVRGPEIIAYRLHIHTQFIGNTMHRTVRKTILKIPEFIKSKHFHPAALLPTQFMTKIPISMANKFKAK